MPQQLTEHASLEVTIKWHLNDLPKCITTEPEQYLIMEPESYREPLSDIENRIAHWNLYFIMETVSHNNTVDVIFQNGTHISK
jgi:hypothetical protein